MNVKNTVVTTFYLIIAITANCQVTDEGMQQNATPISTLLIKANIIPTGFSIERGVFSTTSFELGGGVTYDFAYEPNSLSSPLFIWGNPFLNVKLNQYIGRGKMEQQGKQVFNNAGRYISLDYQYTFPPVVHINEYPLITSKVNNSRVGITLGSKTNIGEYFQLGSEAGIGVILIQGLIMPTYIFKASIGFVLEAD